MLETRDLFSLRLTPRLGRPTSGARGAGRG